MVPPGWSSPEASAASIIRLAMRSFTDPPGLRYSTLASTSGPVEPSGRSRVRDSRTSGVLPTRSSSDSEYSMAAKIARAEAVGGIGEDGAVDADSPASRTALRAARHRAAHQLLEDGVILADPLAVRVLGEPEESVRTYDGEPRMRWFVC